MPRQIALFANGNVGLAVARYLASTGDEVKVLFLSGQYPDIDSEILAANSGYQDLRVHFGDLRLDLNFDVDQLENYGVDTIITVYWPFILPEYILENVELTVNFHPALLPLNRGWYPHVHNIIEGSAAGVTLHKLSREADEGDIWAQKEVIVNPWDCASDLYNKLQEEITNLFFEKWPLIRDNSIHATPQEHNFSSYHAKKEIDKLNRIDLNKTYTGSEIINLLRARTFGERGFAYFENGDEKIYVRIKLDKNPM